MMDVHVFEFTDKRAPMICPLCEAGEHWDHQFADSTAIDRGPPIELGQCRAYDTISNERCACPKRPTTR